MQELNKVLLAKAKAAFAYQGNQEAQELIFTPRGVPFADAKAAGEYCKAKGLNPEELIVISRKDLLDASKPTGTKKAPAAKAAGSKSAEGDGKKEDSESDSGEEPKGGEA